MSESITKTVLTVSEWDAVKKSGLNFAIPGTNAFDAAAHEFAEIIRAQSYVPELLAALKSAQRYANAERIDMLCKAGGYSAAALLAAQQSQYWQKVMADCAAIDAAIAKATGVQS